MNLCGPHFEVVNNKLSQVIRPPCKVPLPVDDLQFLPENVREPATRLDRPA
jgi:hypothetical protein